MRAVLICAALFSALAMAGRARALPVTYGFTAQVTEASDTLPAGGPAAIGATFTGTFTYDPDVPPLPGDPSVLVDGYAYAAHSAYAVGDITAGDLTFEGGVSDTLAQVFNRADGYDNEFFRVREESIEGSTVRGTPIDWGYHEITFLAYDDLAGFDGTALPTTLELSDFDYSEYSFGAITADGTYWHFRADVTSLTLLGDDTSGGGGGDATVPELDANAAPNAITLIGFGVIMLYGRRGRRA